MEDHAGVTRVDVLRQLGLTEQMVRDHVIRPDHVKAAALHIELRDAGDGDDDASVVRALQDCSTVSTPTS